MRIALITIVAVLIASCGKTEIDTSVTPPDTIFAHTVGEELVGDVENIEGGGNCWQGYVAYLRFKTDLPVEKLLQDAGYAEVEWSVAESSFQLPKEFLTRFSPPWDPSSLTQKRCFSKSNVTNSWTHGGTHYYIIDKDSGIVHFYGIGA
jgi:hypothetical protein